MKHRIDPDCTCTPFIDGDCPHCANQKMEAERQAENAWLSAQENRTFYEQPDPDVERHNAMVRELLIVPLPKECRRWPECDDPDCDYLAMWLDHRGCDFRCDLHVLRRNDRRNYRRMKTGERFPAGIFSQHFPIEGENDGK